MRQVFQPSRPQSVVRGAAFIVSSAAVFSCVGAIVKALSHDIPVAMIVFFRSFFGMACLLPWIFRQPAFAVQSGRLRLHLLRALAGLSAMYCFFFALSRLKLAEAVVLNFTAPIFIGVLAFFWLGESIGRKTNIALIIGFIGVILIANPDTGVFRPAALIGLLSAMFAAVALVSIRRLSDTEPPPLIVFYFGVFASILSFPAAAMVWETLTWLQWGLAIAMGIMATMGQLLLTHGYASAPAGQVGFFQYSSVVFSALLGWFIWEEIPVGSVWWGILLILAAGYLASGQTLTGSGTAILELYKRMMEGVKKDENA